MLKLRTIGLAGVAFVASWILTAAEENVPGVSSAPSTDNASTKGSFWQGFLASLSVVIVSELADKTFFIAAIMAMKHSRIIVFSGAISALVFMTVLSAAFGWIATVVPRVYTHYISAALFAIFGLKMLRDGWKMDPNEGQEELDEVQTELKRREEQGSPNKTKSPEESRSQSPESVIIRDGSRTSLTPRTPEARRSLQSPKSPEAETISPVSAKTPDEGFKEGPKAADSPKSPVSPKSPDGPKSPESPKMPEPQAGPSTQPDSLREDKEETVEMLEQGQAETRRRKRNAVLKVYLQAATLTFLAEWGDRSQLATVVLATREDVFGVIVGGSLGHALCTGLAVIGGRMVAQKISVRTVTIIGGVVFLFFAVSALIMGPGE